MSEKSEEYEKCLDIIAKKVSYMDNLYMDNLVEKMVKEIRKMNRFEKISLEEVRKEYGDNFNMSIYEDLELPKRGSRYSAGYDFHSPVDVVIAPGESVTIKTLVKCHIVERQVLLIVVRSSLGFKHNVRLVNTVAVIDSDYYNNEKNEGHIMIKLYNAGDHIVEIKKGERFAQGIFVEYGLTEDDDADGERTGGIGSTGV